MFLDVRLVIDISRIYFSFFFNIVTGLAVSVLFSYDHICSPKVSVTASKQVSRREEMES